MNGNLKRDVPLLALATLCLLPIAAPVQAQIPAGDIRVDLELVAEGLTSPVTATHAGDGSGRLFVVDQIGQIRIIQDGVLLSPPFLDLTGEIVDLNPFFDERGLLGLAFHPDYRCNGRFFVRYSKERTGSEGEPCFGTSRGCHEEILAEYRVSGDPNIANPEGTILFRIDEPQFNHNAGHVAFGPDGFLYFSLGDGGGAHDGLADVPPSHGPIGNGQNVNTALGSVLRIDVDSPAQDPLAYAIPEDNPFVGGEGLDEIYAYGLRNPYRFAFDLGAGDDEDADDDEDGDGVRRSHPFDDHVMREGDAGVFRQPTFVRDGHHDCDDADEDDDFPDDDGARLFLADVGQNLFEEVDIIEPGKNYGWVIREGAHCFDPFNPGVPPADCPDTGPSGEPLIDPIAEYDHDDGIAVVGGFVYRGSRSPELFGKYVFGDFSRTFSLADGRLFYLDADGDTSQIFEFLLGETNDPLGEFVFGFGEDEEGELYLLSSDNLGPSGSAGKVHRIAGPDGSVPMTVEETRPETRFSSGWPSMSPARAQRQRPTNRLERRRAPDR